MISEEFLRDTGSGARIGSHVRALEGVRHPVAAPEALERAADYLAESLRSLGYQLSEHLFQDSGRTFRNVIASRAGLLRPEERVAILAHYDTVAETPGADDNASGVAVLLEMARALSQLSFERTVHFIGVCLEENRQDDDPDSGTRGSGALARHARRGMGSDGRAGARICRLRRRRCGSARTAGGTGSGPGGWEFYRRGGKRTVSGNFPGFCSLDRAAPGRPAPCAADGTGKRGTASGQPALGPRALLGPGVSCGHADRYYQFPQPPLSPADGHAGDLEPGVCREGVPGCLRSHS